MSKACPIDQ